MEFTQEQQTEIVGDAMNLTAAIECEEKELNNLRAQRFHDKPAAPQRRLAKPVQQIRPSYPARPKTDYSIEKHIGILFKRSKKAFIIAGIVVAALIILSIIIGIATQNKSSGASIIFGVVPLIIFLISMAIPVLLVVILVTFFGERNRLNAELAQNPDYQNAVKEAEAQAVKKQQELNEQQRAEQTKLDSEYKAELQKYETETVPAYERERDNWEKTRKQKITALENDKQILSESLKTLYDTTRLLSVNYRELWILKWLYDDMSSSDHELRYATELLDRDRQRIATEEAGRRVRDAVTEMDRNMRGGFGSIYEAIQEGNQLQSETMRLVKKTRRDMNIGTFITAVQNKKTQEQLGDIASKLDK